MGPKVTEDSLDGDLRYVRTAREEGATIAIGSERNTELDGHFVEPTVLTDVEWILKTRLPKKRSPVRSSQ